MSYGGAVAISMSASEKNVKLLKGKKDGEQKQSSEEIEDMLDSLVLNLRKEVERIKGELRKKQEEEYAEE